MGLRYPSEKLIVTVIILGDRNRHMPGVMPGVIPGVMPGVMPGEDFPLLILQIFGRVRGKGNLPPILLHGNNQQGQ